MKVLFIGGTGNISSASSRLAIASGVELWHLNRGQSGSIVGVQNIFCDINNSDNVKEKLGSHNWDCVVNWVAFTQADIERDIQLFSGKTKQYIFISSASAYQSLARGSVITEQTPLGNPYWQYSRDKIACERRLMNAFYHQNFPVTIVRPSHTYSTVIPIAIGGWREYTTIDRIKRGLPVVVHGDGSSLWVLTHADDFALGLVGLIGSVESIGEAYHITSDEVLSWNQIYQHIGDALNIKPVVVAVPSERICQLDSSYTGTLLGDKSVSVTFDNSKIKNRVPGFKCAIPFAVGIAATLQWFEADFTRQTVLPKTNQFIDRLLTGE